VQRKLLSRSCRLLTPAINHRCSPVQVIVFSDNVWALETYARALNKNYIYGKMSHAERTEVLAGFKKSQGGSTVFLSKVIPDFTSAFQQLPSIQCHLCFEPKRSVQ